LRRVIAAQPNDLFCATRIYVAGYRTPHTTKLHLVERRKMVDDVGGSLAHFADGACQFLYRPRTAPPTHDKCCAESRIRL
jgi:hypothetical protein